MKRLLAIGMILFSHSAYAEWVKLAESTGTIVFVDPSTKKGGLMPRVWILLDYSKPETSERVLFAVFTKQIVKTEGSED